MDQSNSVSLMMNYLVDHQAPNLPATALAEIFDRLCWIIDDNGEKIETERRKWLHGSDKGRVAVALAMKDAFPFNDRETMVTELERIALQWPDLAESCQRMIDSWDKTVSLRNK